MLMQVAEGDEDRDIRTAAAQAVTALWSDVPSVADWLDERIQNDPAEQARAQLETYRIWLQSLRRRQR